MEKIDVCIVGAGVIGLALAARLARPDQSLLILERHEAFGTETSSRNSEVIHAGIYYPTGSLKAKLCLAGKQALYAYCEHAGIPHRRLGKLIVATEPEEEPALQGLLEKARANGVDDLEWISGKELQKKEPALRASLALLSPSTGIIDSHALMRSLLGQARARGADLALKTAVKRVEALASGFRVEIEGDESLSFETRLLINAAGLGAQALAHSIQGLDPQTIPPLYLCKGNYFTLQGQNPFSRLIYPVPEKNHTGLGIHLTLDLAGQARFGPDTEYLKEIDYTVSEAHLAGYYQSIRRYFPGLPEGSLQPGYVGIRPKLQGPGDPVRDFVIQTETEHGLRGLVNLFGIESPGLTASLALADWVAQALSHLEA